VTQWWLATAGAAAAPSLAGRLPPGAVLASRAQLATSILRNPVAAAPQRAVLAVAGAAALLAIAGLLVSIAAGASYRRTESALLAALGVGRRPQARQLFLQELMLSLPSAVAGLALGVLVTILLVPVVILTPAATPPVPPALTEFAWSQAVPLAAFIALLPAVLAAAAAARRADPAASLRAAGPG
jgi:ABC-type antimicrobial peptide transport system permease subunit